MKRPLFVAGLTAFTTLGCLFYLHIQKSTLLLTLSGVLTVLTLAFYKKLCTPRIWITVFLTVFLFSVFYFMHLHTRVLPVAALQGQTARLTATVLTAPDWQNDYFTCVVETDSIAGTAQKAKVLLYVHTLEDVAVQDTVTAQVQFAEINRSFYAEGVYISAQTEALERVVSPEGFFVPRALEALRKGIRTTLNRNLPTHYAGLLQALLLGDKSRLPEDINAAFRVCGLSHLLAVSGLHLSVICTALGRLLKRLQLRRWAAATVSLFIVVGIMAVTGFSTSVVRAGCMHLLVLWGQLVLRRGDALNALGAAVLFMFLPNPFTAGDISLLLSAGSVLGILLLCPYITPLLYRCIRIYGRLGKCLRGGAEIVSMTLAANIFTLPVQMLAFGEVSLLSIPANLAVAGVSSLLLVLTTVTLLLSALPLIQLVSPAVFWVVQPLAGCTVAIPTLLSRLPFATLYADIAYLVLCVGFALFLVAIFLALRPVRRRGLLCAGLCVLLALCSTFAYQLANRNVTHVALLQTDYGYCVVLSRNQTAVVIGLPMGTYGQVYYHLRTRQIRQVALLLLPTADACALQQAEELQALLPVRQIGVLGQENSPAKGIDLAGVAEFGLWEEDTLTLYPHDYGVSCRIRIGDKTCFLSTAAIDYTALAQDIGTVDLMLCNTAPATGLGTHPDTVYLLGGNRLSTALGAGQLQAQGLTVYIAPEDAKTVAKIQKKGYIRYSNEK